MKKTVSNPPPQFSENYDAIRTFIFILDTEGKVRNINQKGCETLGIKKKDVLNKDWFARFLPSSQRAKLKEMFIHALTVTKKLDESFENSILSRNGKERIMLWHTSFIKNSRGKITGLLCSGEDITIQRKAEIKLRESEENYRALVDSIHQVAFNVDFQENLRNTYPSFVSGRIADITGFSADAFRKGKVTFDKRVHPDDRELTRSLFWKMIESKKRITRVYRFMHKNGDYKWFEDTLIPKVNAQGKVSGCYGVIDEITELKTAKAAIHDFEMFFSLSLDMFCIAGTDGYFKKINKSFERALGYTTEELLSKPFIDFVHPDDYEKTLNELKNLGKGLSTVSFENRYQCKDGSYKWFSWNSAPANEEGLVYAAARDISIKKSFELDLRNKSAFLDSVVENIPNMIFIKDAKELKFVRFNKAGEELLGISRKFMLGKSDHHFFPKKEADFFEKKDREVLIGKKLVDIPEEKIHTRNKGERLLHTKKIPLYDEAGNPEYLLGISEDITEARKAQEALRKSEEKYRDIVHLIHDGILMIDKDHKTTFVNEAMANMLNYLPAEMIGKRLTEFMDDEGKKISKANMESLKKGNKKTLDYKFKTKDGQDRWTILSSHSIFDSKRKYSGAIAAVADVTERRKQEEIIRENEQRLSESQKIARVGTWEFDALSDKIRWSEETFRLFGMKPEKRFVTREEYRNRIHPSDRDKVISLVTEAIQHGTPFEIEMRVVWDDGSIHYLLGRCKPIIKKGKVIKLLGTGIDITQNKLAEIRVMKAMAEGQDMERRRISLDLHDSLGQKLSAMKIFVENNSDKKLPQSVENAKKLDHILNETIEEVRNISQNLMPSALEDFGLEKALLNLCNKCNKRNGTMVKFQAYDVETGTNSFIMITVYRVAQELITNSLKHAKASEINVQLFQRDKTIVLTVEDDGIGFKLQKINFDETIGLNSIASRVQSLNGNINIETKPGRGVITSIEIPLSQ